MKQNKLTLIVGAVVAIIFVLLLFVFQVRTTEIAVKTTFGKPTTPISEPGAYFKLPWPIQSVYKFDKRIQTFEDVFEETFTADSFNLMAMLYVGWKIDNPEVFLRRFANGSVEEAQRTLEGIVRSAKNAVIGQYQFSDFISTDSEKVRLIEVESRILSEVQESLASEDGSSRYGVAVEFLGIKKLGIPESITEKVIARMEAERSRDVSEFTGKGEFQSSQIRSDAERESRDLILTAEAEAERILGEGDAEAAKYYEIFREDPDFANWLEKVKALEKSLGPRSTIILDPRTPPFDLLISEPQN